MKKDKWVIALFFLILGIGLLLAGELAILLKKKSLSVWVTPLCWTGYIFLLDSLLFFWKGRSPLYENPKQFVWTFPLSTAFWLIFEAYNLILKNWEYIGLPEHPLVRALGCAWAFATILPALIETNQLLEEWGVFKQIPIRPKPIPPWGLRLSFVLGSIFLIYPLLSRTPFDFPPVWLGFVFLLEPVTYWYGGASLVKEMEQGQTQRFWTLLLSGLWMGLLWEFWNFWAGAKWVYHVPYPTPFYIFEMPFTGFFGFLPFGIEFYCMYQATLLLIENPRKTGVRVCRQDHSVSRAI